MLFAIAWEILNKKLDNHAITQSHEDAVLHNTISNIACKTFLIYCVNKALRLRWSVFWPVWCKWLQSASTAEAEGQTWVCFGKINGKVRSVCRFQSRHINMQHVALHGLRGYGNPVADPGFPRGGGANSPGGGGAPTHDFAKNSPKLHEIERIWTPGGRVPCAPP